MYEFLKDNTASSQPVGNARGINIITVTFIANGTQTAFSVGNNIGTLFSVSINGLVINFVIHILEFTAMSAGRGSYNFRIIDFTSFVTIVLPNSSWPFSDKVQLSSSQDETKFCSLLSKLIKWVKYLLSFSGSVNFKCLECVTKTS